MNEHFFRVRATHGDGVRAGRAERSLAETYFSGIKPITTETKTNIPLASPALGEGEIAALVKVARSGQFCQGAATERFEQAMAEMIGLPHTIAVSSGSAALLVAMQALGIGPGDEVIVPDVTFVSTATAAVYLGATPVFCDIALDNYCINVEQIASLITPRTRLIVPVHLGGRVADMAAMGEIARSHDIPILEDAAGAHMASRDGQLAGTMGDAAIFSFTPTKLITTGEGGMIVTRDADLAQHCRRIRNFGDHGKFIWRTLGFNFRMTDFSAAIGCEQVGRINENISRRQTLADRYNNALANIAGLRIPKPLTGEQPNQQLYTLLLDEKRLGISRDEVGSRLARQGIDSRLYYPALHKMPVFADGRVQGDEAFPAAIHYERTALSLPLFPQLSDSQQQQVIDAVLDIIDSASGGTNGRA